MEQAGPGRELSERLGYLLKHASQRLAAVTGEALAPFGIDDRRLAVLLLIGSNEPMSQQQAAERLGIDRTTMVAVLDDLAGGGLVTRAPHPGDRRRNVIAMTTQGRATLSAAMGAWDEAERAFLAALSQEEALQLRRALRMVGGIAVRETHSS